MAVAVLVDDAAVEDGAANVIVDVVFVVPVNVVVVADVVVVDVSVLVMMSLLWKLLSCQTGLMLFWL